MRVCFLCLFKVATSEVGVDTASILWCFVKVVGQTRQAVKLSLELSTDKREYKINIRIHMKKLNNVFNFSLFERN